MKDPWTERKCSSKVDHMLEPCVGAIGEPREHHAPMQSWVNVNPSRLHVLHIALFGKLRGEVEAGVCEDCPKPSFRVAQVPEEFGGR